MKRAEAEAKAELIKEKMREFMTNAIDGPSFMENLMGLIGKSGSANMLFSARQAGIKKEINALQDYNSPVANPQKAQQDSLAHTIQTNNAAVDINIKDPNNRTTATTYAPFVKVKTTSTMGAQK
jgi:hypothetical protein